MKIWNDVGGTGSVGVGSAISPLNAKQLQVETSGIRRVFQLVINYTGNNCADNGYRFHICDIVWSQVIRIPKFSLISNESETHI